jgi:hypothetical protein
MLPVWEMPQTATGTVGIQARRQNLAPALNLLPLPPDERQTRKDNPMNRIILAAAAILTLGTVGATAGELPSYDFAGFPITPFQMSVLGQSGAMREQPAAPMRVIDGMPASPMQIAVLSRRPTTTTQAARPFWAAENQIGITIRAQ